LLGGSENTRKFSIKIAGVHAEVRTEYLIYTGLERYLWISLFGD
jgi:hypothetical protein